MALIPGPSRPLPSRPTSASRRPLAALPRARVAPAWLRLAALCVVSACGANEAPRIHSATRLANTEALGPFELWADVSDDVGVSRVALLYRTWADDGADQWSAFEELSMETLGGRVFRAELPAQAPGTLVEYEIAAVDGDGLVARFPGRDALVRFTAGALPASESSR